MEKIFLFPEYFIIIDFPPRVKRKEIITTQKPVVTAKKMVVTEEGTLMSEESENKVGLQNEKVIGHFILGHSLIDSI
jgi:hypothetical protein